MIPGQINRHRLWLRKRTLACGTWNVQGISGKLVEVVKEIDSLEMDIVILNETKKKGKGQELIGNYIHFWSGVPKSERAKSGVAVLIKKKWKSGIIDWKEISDRIIHITIRIYESMVDVIGVYAPNNDASCDEKRAFMMI
ncbi:hypothetical protein ANN_26900 [Periplaneta americana]|uniref:Endonuclease/exonuclease/phosphatase domain-containing protein n=1 Tax=Periplaneta americana TaxID=6978 RepID=A0ABQ8RWN1_PERAM|nr:hypothetical protein ANN_26900 [Periplaneta americana]